MATKSKDNCVLLNDSEWSFIKQTEARNHLRARWNTYGRWGQVFAAKKDRFGEINIFQLVSDLTEIILRPENRLSIITMADKLYVKENWLAGLFARMLLEMDDHSRAP